MLRHEGVVGDESAAGEENATGDGGSSAAVRLHGDARDGIVVAQQLGDLGPGAQTDAMVATHHAPQRRDQARAALIGTGMKPRHGDLARTCA